MLTNEEKRERERKLIDWTREGEREDVGDTDVWEDQVWWGYWRHVGGEDTNPPDALFRTMEEAEAFAVVVGKDYDIHVGPVVLKIEARDTRAW